MIKIITTTLALIVLSATVFAQSPHAAIVAKDGKACAAQFDDAIKVNIRPELRKELSRYVAAIRYAENGKTYQYGIIHKRCKAGGQLPMRPDPR